MKKDAKCCPRLHHTDKHPKTRVWGLLASKHKITNYVKIVTNMCTYLKLLIILT